MIHEKIGCKHFLKSKGLNLKACFCVQMPDTRTPIFDLSDKKEVEKTNRNAEKEVELLCKQIEENKKRHGHYVNPNNGCDVIQDIC